jgi:hypothetical protein
LAAIDAPNKPSIAMSKARDRALNKNAEDEIFYNVDRGLHLEPEALDIDPITAEIQLRSNKNTGSLIAPPRQNFARPIPERKTSKATSPTRNSIDRAETKDDALNDTITPKAALRASFNTDMSSSLLKKGDGNVKTSYLASSTGRLSIDEENKIVYKELGKLHC